MRKKNLLHASLDQGLVRHGNGIEIEAFACHSKHGTTFFFLPLYRCPSGCHIPASRMRAESGMGENSMQCNNPTILLRETARQDDDFRRLA